MDIINETIIRNEWKDITMELAKACTNARYNYPSHDSVESLKRILKLYSGYLNDLQADILKLNEQKNKHKLSE